MSSFAKRGRRSGSRALERLEQHLARREEAAGPLREAVELLGAEARGPRVGEVVRQRDLGRRHPRRRRTGCLRVDVDVAVPDRGAPRPESARPRTRVRRVDASRGCRAGAPSRRSPRRAPRAGPRSVRAFSWLRRHPERDAGRRGAAASARPVGRAVVDEHDHVGRERTERHRAIHGCQSVSAISRSAL